MDSGNLLYGLKKHNICFLSEVFGSAPTKVEPQKHSPSLSKQTGESYI